MSAPRRQTDAPDGAAPNPSPAASALLSKPLRRNIEALRKRRDEELANASREERIAEAITRFTGSMRFVYLHLAVFGLWIGINLTPGLPHFDESFVVLAMVASVEAIFLSTFVLISQNRASASADKRSDLDLQISLLTEHELTRLVEMVAAIADKIDAAIPRDDELDEIKKDIAPERVLEEIERQGAR